MGLKLITAPSVEPFTLAQAKAHLRVDHDDDDALIDELIAAVRQHIDGADGWLGRALVTQTWELTIDQFPASEIMIPIPPLQEIVSIKYDDTDGDEQTVSAADYQVDTVSAPGWVVPVSDVVWPTCLTAINAVRVRFKCGYPPTTDSPPDLRANVPAPIKAALKLFLGDLYENRAQTLIGQTAIELPWAAKALLSPYRIYSH